MIQKRVFPFLFLWISLWATLAVGQTPAESPTPIASPSPSPSASSSPSTLHPIVIKQLDVDGKRAVADLGDFKSKVTQNSRLVASSNGRDCFLKVTSVKEELAQLDGLHCDFFSDLITGQTLEISLFDEHHEPPADTEPVKPHWISPTPERETEHTDHRLRFAISPYFGAGASLESSNLYYSQSGSFVGYGTGNFTMNAAPGIAVEVYDTPTNSFGFSAGMSYDFQRTVKGIDAYANGSSIGGNFYSPNASLSLLALYGNAIYRFTNFYIPFGVNYAIPFFQGGSNAFGNTTLTGDIGIQIAVGFVLTDNISVEFWLEQLLLEGNSNTANGTINYNGLSLTNPEFRLRFSF